MEHGNHSLGRHTRANETEDDEGSGGEMNCNNAGEMLTITTRHKTGKDCVFLLGPSTCSESTMAEIMNCQRSRCLLFV